MRVFDANGFIILRAPIQELTMVFPFSFHFLAWSKKLAKKSRLRIRFPLQIAFKNHNQSSSKGFSSASETRCLAQELLALLSINSFQFALKNNSYYVGPIQIINYFINDHFEIEWKSWFWNYLLLHQHCLQTTHHQTFVYFWVVFQAVQILTFRIFEMMG